MCHRAKIETIRALLSPWIIHRPSIVSAEAHKARACIVLITHIETDASPSPSTTNNKKKCDNDDRASTTPREWGTRRFRLVRSLSPGKIWGEDYGQVRDDRHITDQVSVHAQHHKQQHGTRAGGRRTRSRCHEEDATRVVLRLVSRGAVTVVVVMVSLEGGDDDHLRVQDAR